MSCWLKEFGVFPLVFFGALHGLISAVCKRCWFLDAGMQRSGGGAGGKLLGSSSVFFVGLKSLFWGFLFVSFGGPYFDCAYCCWASFLVII